MNRVELKEFGLKASFLLIGQERVYEILTEKGKFTILESPLTATISLSNPQVIYSPKFHATVASFLTNGKLVEISCGKKGMRGNFLANELLEGMPKENISAQVAKAKDKAKDKEDFLFEAKVEELTRKRFLGLVKNTNVSVIYDLKKVKDSNNGDSNAPEVTGQSPYDVIQEGPWEGMTIGEVDDAFAAYGNDWVLEIPRLVWKEAIEVEIGEDNLQSSLSRIGSLVNEYELVNVKRKDLKGFKYNGSGIYVVRNIEDGEIIINLNGNTYPESRAFYSSLLNPLIIHFLQQGDRVAIDYDIDEPIDVLAGIESNECFKEIFEAMPNTEVNIESRETLNDTSKHSFITLKRSDTLAM